MVQFQLPRHIAANCQTACLLTDTFVKPHSELSHFNTFKTELPAIKFPGKPGLRSALQTVRMPHSCAKNRRRNANETGNLFPGFLFSGGQEAAETAFWRVRFWRCYWPSTSSFLISLANSPYLRLSYRIRRSQKTLRHGRAQRVELISNVC